LTFIENNSGFKSGDIAKKPGIPRPTVKRILPELIDKNLIENCGTGPSPNYSIK
jgi:DNA-binding IclR family transcriptional regulator